MWIACKDQMPPVDSWVFGWVEYLHGPCHGTVDQRALRFTGSCWQSRTPSHPIHLDRVSHWMPIPPR
jgi:hypothetical protein